MYKTLNEKILQNKFAVGILGLGYVGLPLAKQFCLNKIKVFGIDIDKKKISNLKKNISYIKTIQNKDIVLMNKNKFMPTTNFSIVKKCDVLIFCLPTPLDKHQNPDMSYITNTLEATKFFFKKGQLFILESTTYPGTTEEFFLPIFEKKKFKVGKDVFLGYSPEREDPGNEKYSIDKITKIVSGFTIKCLNLTDSVYNFVVKSTFKVKNIRTAEMTKLLENIYRCINVGLVNELKIVCQKMGLDIFDIIKAASTKPFGFQPFYPGPGLGGHCIPIDPFILTWKAKQYKVNTKFIELAGQINEQMPSYVVSNLQNALSINNKPLTKANILILGVAYKKNVDDIRESPSLEVIEILKKIKANIFYHDPYIKKIEKSRHHNLFYKSIKLNYINLSKFDAIIILTDHDFYDYQKILKFSNLIIDARGRLEADNKKVFRS